MYAAMLSSSRGLTVHFSFSQEFTLHTRTSTFWHWFCPTRLRFMMKRKGPLTRNSWRELRGNAKSGYRKGRFWSLINILNLPSSYIRSRPSSVNQAQFRVTLWPQPHPIQLFHHHWFSNSSYIQRIKTYYAQNLLMCACKRMWWGCGLEYL